MRTGGCRGAHLSTCVGYRSVRRQRRLGISLALNSGNLAINSENKRHISLITHHARTFALSNTTQVNISTDGTRRTRAEANESHARRLCFRRPSVWPICRRQPRLFTERPSTYLLRQCPKNSAPYGDMRVFDFVLIGFFNPRRNRNAFECRLAER